ncbi:NADAR family protein [Streptomyces sp. NPDC057963]|uniref:NADAR family protein n=1 Tax=Streptomyces sp. NPDC057963 TaxID=3346290 RepID=UPI0036E02409
MRRLASTSSRTRTSGFRPHPHHQAATETLKDSRTSLSEHYFQAQKSIGTRHADLIRRARTPLRAAELGRDPSKPLRREWDRVKDDVMRRAVATKFRAHADIRDILLSTADEEIVGDTTTDHYWGRGRTGTGKNMLGRPEV